MKSIAAQNIKDIIREKGLKSSYVAEKAGYSQQQFSAMMNGRKIIKDTDILRITTALGVDANRLFEKRGE